MATKYIIKKHLAEGLIKIYSVRYGNQLWVLSDQKVRKNHECSICEAQILKGKDRTYRPLSNLENRMDRICINHVA